MATYTPKEYIEVFLFHNEKVSAMTVKRRCRHGLLPSNHIAKKLPGKTGGWVIEVKEVSLV